MTPTAPVGALFLRALRLDADLVRLSESRGVALIDADRLVAELGGEDHVVAPLRYSPAASRHSPRRQCASSTTSGSSSRPLVEADRRRGLRCDTTSTSSSRPPGGSGSAAAVARRRGPRSDTAIPGRNRRRRAHHARGPPLGQVPDQAGRAQGGDRHQDQGEPRWRLVSSDRGVLRRW